MLTCDHVIVPMLYCVGLVDVVILFSVSECEVLGSTHMNYYYLTNNILLNEYSTLSTSSVTNHKVHLDRLHLK